MTENFLNLVKEVDTRAQKVQPVPTKMNPKRPTPRHIIIHVTKGKDKERILKEAREKQFVTYKGAPVRLLADFSTETFQARRNLHELFKVMENGDLQPRLLYSARLSFRIGEIKNFLNTKEVKEFITTKPVLQEMLKELLKKEKNKKIKNLNNKMPITIYQ